LISKNLWFLNILFSIIIKLKLYVQQLNIGVFVLKHIGIIMDGNRRFAKRLVKKPWMGHKWGLEKARDVLQWACEANIKYFTAYTLSLENLKSRPKNELKLILSYVEKEIDEIMKNKNHIVHRFNVSIRFIGRIRVLPKNLQKKIRDAEKLTKNYNKHFLNIALAYGGQQEIVDATKKILKKGLKGIIKPSNINEEVIKHHLYTNGQPFPDLIIRTGGEKRLSNFLSFQSAYSELIFIDKKWPEITKRDFTNTLKEFERRQRRFGG
jgi:tritrans,polycis-undecaprenyl-diphosphate synthase [geranylgeranyl-diphosphate specific]